VQDAKCGGARNSDGAGERIARALRLLGGLLEQPNDLDAAEIVALAFLGKGHTPRRSAQQRHAERGLQFVQETGNGRLTKTQLARDRRQAAALGHPQESAHPIEADVHLSSFRINHMHSIHLPE